MNTPKNSFVKILQWKKDTQNKWSYVFSHEKLTRWLCFMWSNLNLTEKYDSNADYSRVRHVVSQWPDKMFQRGCLWHQTKAKMKQVTISAEILLNWWLKLRIKKKKYVEHEQRGTWLNFTLTLSSYQLCCDSIDSIIIHIQKELYQQ